MASACATAPSEVEPHEGPQVWVKSVHLPDSEPWYTHFADHTWFEVRSDLGVWRVEVLHPTSGVVIEPISVADLTDDDRWGRRVQVLRRFTGERAERVGAALLARAPDYPWRDAYNAYPGPNSNTFAVWLAREIDGLEFQPHSTAIGQDFAEDGRLGLTPNRTGVELENSWLGLELGLAEGARLQIAGLALGVGLWPPRVELPFLRGLPRGF
jgi:hypothetical protein